ncbi:hypothetical protein NL676_004067 [Syzygium grande]|nr:hypothetical protein NL676_004067 [Syzygium grande]
MEYENDLRLRFQNSAIEYDVKSSRTGGSASQEPTNATHPIPTGKAVGKRVGARPPRHRLSRLPVRSPRRPAPAHVRPRRFPVSHARGLQISAHSGKEDIAKKIFNKITARTPAAAIVSFPPSFGDSLRVPQ